LSHFEAAYITQMQGMHQWQFLFCRKIRPILQGSAVRQRARLFEAPPPSGPPAAPQPPPPPTPALPPALYRAAPVGIHWRQQQQQQQQ
jgi:hypothetical protein